MTNLSVETYHLTDKLHFESQLFQELVLRNRDHKKTWKSNEQENLSLLLIVRIDSTIFIRGDCLKSQIFFSENRKSASGTEYFSLARTFRTVWGGAGTSL